MKSRHIPGSETIAAGWACDQDSLRGQRDTSFTWRTSRCDAHEKSTAWQSKGFYDETNNIHNRHGCRDICSSVQLPNQHQRSACHPVDQIQGPPCLTCRKRHCGHDIWPPGPRHRHRHPNYQYLANYLSYQYLANLSHPARSRPRLHSRTRDRPRRSPHPKDATRQSSPPPTIATAPPAPAAPAAPVVADGNTEMTQYGPIQVRVTVTAGKITDVQAVQYPDPTSTDQQMNFQAIPALRARSSAREAHMSTVSAAPRTPPRDTSRRCNQPWTRRNPNDTRHR